MGTRWITGIGETILDMVFKDDTPLAAVPGGSTFNAMISLGRTLGRLGAGAPQLRMVTETGDDHVGDMVLAFMEKNGVDSGAVSRNPGTQTNISLAFLDKDNNAQYEFYKDQKHAPAACGRIANVDFRKGDLVLFGSFFAINPALRSSVLPLVEAAHEAGSVIYYDINFRRNHTGSLPQTMPFIKENCLLSSFVRGSAEDFSYLCGTTDPEKVYREFISPLCPNFICTCGAGPVHIFAPGMHECFDAPQVETVSTIGAGDNFNAGFLYGIIRQGLGKEGPFFPDKDQWARLVHTAGSFSANVCRSIYNYVDEGFLPPQDAPAIV